MKNENDAKEFINKLPIADLGQKVLDEVELLKRMQCDAKFAFNRDILERQFYKLWNACIIFENES